MAIRVEFYGIARRRAGVESLSLPVEKELRLGQVLELLSEHLPELAAECFQGDRLRPGYVANLGGDRFVCDPLTLVSPGDSLLILSADVGGT